MSFHGVKRILPTAMSTPQTTGHKKCRKLDTVRPGKKDAVKKIGRISILQPSLRERGRNSQYRQCGFIGTLNSCEICDVVNE